MFGEDRCYGRAKGLTRPLVLGQQRVGRPQLLWQLLQGLTLQDIMHINLWAETAGRQHTVMNADLGAAIWARHPAAGCHAQPGQPAVAALVCAWCSCCSPSRLVPQQGRRLLHVASSAAVRPSGDAVVMEYPERTLLAVGPTGCGVLLAENRYQGHLPTAHGCEQYVASWRSGHSDALPRGSWLH